MLMGRAATSYVDIVQDALRTEWLVEQWVPGEPKERLDELLDRCDAIALGADAHTHAGFNLGMYQLPKRTGIKLVQLGFSSYDWLDAHSVPSSAWVCNVQVHASTMAEYVIAAVLEWEIGLRYMDAEMRAGNWGRSGALFGQPHGEVLGKTMGLIGFGSIGVEVARRAAPFGMRLLASTRRSRPASDGLEWVGGPERMDELLEQSDYVVVACDLNEFTRGLLDARRLASMKSSAFLVSVTRAGVFDEGALYAALADKRIAGAAIDVWFQYPRSLAAAGMNFRPSRLDFHTLDNIIMTPHASAWTRAHHVRRWKAVATNLDRVSDGQTPQNIVLHPSE